MHGIIKLELRKSVVEDRQSVIERVTVMKKIVHLKRHSVHCTYIPHDSNTVSLGKARQ